MASLKVDYLRILRDYKAKLQDIVAEVAGEKRVTFVVVTREINTMHTRDGNCSTQGVHTPDSSLFIGKNGILMQLNNIIRKFLRQGLIAEKEMVAKFNLDQSSVELL